MQIQPTQIKEKAIVGLSSHGKPVLMIVTHGGLYAFFTKNESDQIETLATAAHKAIGAWLAEKKDPGLRWNAEFNKSELPTDQKFETLHKALFTPTFETLEKAKIYSLASGKMLADVKPNDQVRSIHVDESDPNHLTVSKQLPRNHPAFKGNMYVVGAHSMIRNQIGNPQILQDHDIHLLFHPQSAPHWHLGAVVINNKTGHGKYLHSRHQNVQGAVDDLLNQVISHVKSPQPGGHTFTKQTLPIFNTDLYRNAKISWNDVKQLEPYTDQHQKQWEEEQKREQGHTNKSEELYIVYDSDTKAIGVMDTDSIIEGIQTSELSKSCLIRPTTLAEPVTRIEFHPLYKAANMQYNFRDSAHVNEYLNRGHFAIISAWRHDAHPDENKRNHESLRNDIMSHGYLYTPMMGNWGNQSEPSYMIHRPGFMVHEPDHAIIAKLAQKYKQTAHLYSNHGKHQEISHDPNYQPMPGGKGHQIGTFDSDYSVIDHGNGTTTKFRLNLAPVQKSEDLNKWQRDRTNPLHGIIDPKGGWHPMESEEEHGEALRRLSGKSHPEAFQEGYVSVGHNGTSNHAGQALADPHHPATRTLRNLMRQYNWANSVFLDTRGVGMTGSMDAQHFIKHGALRPYHG